MPTGWLEFLASGKSRNCTFAKAKVLGFSVRCGCCFFGGTPKSCVVLFLLVFIKSTRRDTLQKDAQVEPKSQKLLL